jgi:hypothetical protein
MNLKNQIKTLLIYKYSFIIEHFHCFNDFGFTSVPTYFKNNQNIQSSNINGINSFCLVEENGSPNDIFSKLQLIIRTDQSKAKTFSKLNHKQIKMSDLNIKNVSKLEMTHFLPFEKMSDHGLAPQHLTSNKMSGGLETFNRMNKFETNNFGFIIYHLKNSSLRIGDVIHFENSLIKDKFQVFCDMRQRIFDNSDKINSIKINKIKLNKDCSTVNIFVESVGRPSDHNVLKALISQRKGILQQNAIQFEKPKDKITKKSLNEWYFQIFDFNFQHSLSRLDFNSHYITSNEFKSVKEYEKAPFMAYVRFKVNFNEQKIQLNANLNTFFSFQQRSIYLLMTSWTKCIVFINGFNLGYFSKGYSPYITMFVPKELFIDGFNEIIIFEFKERNQGDSFLYFTHTHVRI